MGKADRDAERRARLESIRKEVQEHVTAARTPSELEDALVYAFGYHHLKRLWDPLGVREDSDTTAPSASEVFERIRLVPASGVARLYPLGLQYNSTVNFSYGREGRGYKRVAAHHDVDGIYKLQWPDVIGHALTGFLPKTTSHRDHYVFIDDGARAALDGDGTTPPAVLAYFDPLRLLRTAVWQMWHLHVDCIADAVETAAVLAHVQERMREDAAALSAARAEVPGLHGLPNARPLDGSVWASYQQQADMEADTWV